MRARDIKLCMILKRKSLFENFKFKSRSGVCFGYWMVRLFKPSFEEVGSNAQCKQTIEEKDIQNVSFIFKHYKIIILSFSIITNCPLIIFSEVFASVAAKGTPLKQLDS